MQLQLLDTRPRRRGGRRRGAGRKPLPANAKRGRTPHRKRPDHKRRTPVHVTLRAFYSVAMLRQQVPLRIIQACIQGVQSATFGVVHYSVQRDHIHLIVEAEDKAVMSSSLKSLTIRLAYRLNKALGRGGKRPKGKVWADRWNAHELKSPREVRNALVYVLFNGIKHGVIKEGLDPCSSAYEAADMVFVATFADQAAAEWQRMIERGATSVVRRPATWLLQTGWSRKTGLLMGNEMPSS